MDLLARCLRQMCEPDQGEREQDRLIGSSGRAWLRFAGGPAQGARAETTAKMTAADPWQKKGSGFPSLEIAGKAFGGIARSDAGVCLRVLCSCFVVVPDRENSTGPFFRRSAVRCTRGPRPHTDGWPGFAGKYSVRRTKTRSRGVRRGFQACIRLRAEQPGSRHNR